MFFEVKVKPSKKVKIVQIGCILLTVVILFVFAALIKASGSLIGLAMSAVTNHVAAFVVGIFVVSLVLPAAITVPMVSFYRERRPRIQVNGAEITFYPLWRTAKKVTLAEITAREVQGDTRGEKIDAALGKALLSPPLAYALDQKYTQAQQAPQKMRYTYYSGRQKLITLSTKRPMENLARFDQMVVDKLAGKLPATSAQAKRPVWKTKRPLLLLGLAGAVCIAFVAINVLTLRPVPPSPDLLAGTSWLSGDDNSQWVFHTDQTFAWYQRKGQTDDNYFAGTYEFHSGQDAVYYLTHSLSDYGLTKRDVKRVIAQNPAYALDNFVCFSCLNQSFMLCKQEQLTEDVRSAYIGFLLRDGMYMDITNMTTGTGYGFTKK